MGISHEYHSTSHRARHGGVSGKLRLAGVVLAILVLAYAITAILENGASAKDAQSEPVASGIAQDILAPLPMQGEAADSDSSGDSTAPDGSGDAQAVTLETFGPARQDAAAAVVKAYDASVIRQPSCGQVDLNYFADAAFLGDSLTVGFSEEELLAGKCQTLDEILPEVLAEVKPFEEQFGHAIPVFVAGGIYTGEDIAHYAKMGAAGAQLATRFIPTYECDASQTYKDVLLAAKPEDVRIIHSPVGMPGRALATPLVQKLEQGLRFPPKHCARCLKACEPAKVPYCITHALIEAVKGNVEEGLFFCGANVSRLDRMRSVRELMEELMDDWRKHQ